MTNNPINVILISGRIGTGKDLVSNYININYDFKKCAFADSLKNIAIKSLNWDEQKDDKGRQLLQDLGKTARAYDEDIWIKKLVDNTICPYYVFGDITNFVISDLRFKNEFDNIGKYIRDKIGNDKADINIITIRIQGSNFSDRKDSNDISEHDLDGYILKFKYIINNNTTKKNVYNQVDMIMNDCGFKKIEAPEMC